MHAASISPAVEQDVTCGAQDMALTPPREPPPQPREQAAGESNRDSDGDAKKERDQKKSQSIPPAAAGRGEFGLSSLPPGQLPSALPPQCWSGFRGPTWLTYCQDPLPLPSPR